jgi:hypothetical protein
MSTRILLRKAKLQTTTSKWRQYKHEESMGIANVEVFQRVAIMEELQETQVLSRLCTICQGYHECLDWQPSQFINIVGKDDIAIPGICSGGGGEGQTAARHCCRQPSPAQHLYFPQFTESSLATDEAEAVHCICPSSFRHPCIETFFACTA